MAAGLGFKTFTTGEVLTAADTNGYLMQGVLVFASAAARNAAITSPQEGQFAYTKDTNGLWYYDGAAWVASGATGDIEGVTAGIGISGGGTSGTVTITNDMATTITASGDIVVGTGSGTYDNLPIGTTGQLLTADTTVSPYKVKWATPSAAAFSGAQARNTSSQSIPNSTETAVIFDSEIFDSGSYWATGNNTRFTVPSTGKYSISVNMLFHYSPAANVTVKIYKNGSFAYQNDRLSFSSPSNCNAAYIGRTSLIDLTANDYVEIFVNQNSGSAQSIQGNNSETGAMQWSITYLGA